MPPPDDLLTADPLVVLEPAAPAAADAPARKKGALGIGGWLCATWLLLVVGSAVLAPILPIEDPEKVNFAIREATPPFSKGALLGTDDFGYDILARLIWGSRVSLTVALGVVGVGMVVGGLIGLLAGYYGGRVETVLMGVIDILLAFPALIALIALTAILGGPGLRTVVVGISLISIPAFARISRATTLAFAQREFVLAARAAGATNARIIRLEVLPNVMFPVAAYALIVIGVAIVAEGSLAFLGLSVPSPQPSWGSMIDGGRTALTVDGILFISLIPAVVMFLTVLSINFLGDRLRARFDVRESSL